MPHPEDRPAPRLRPATTRPVSLQHLAEAAGDTRMALVPAAGIASWDSEVTGISIDSRIVEPGDLYVALPGARVHGVQFAPQAVDAGAAAILTDAEGAALVPNAGVPVLTAPNLRRLVGPLAARIFASQPDDGSGPDLFGVTGTNGKTTTTYFITSLLRALGRNTGLIGTIEIIAGQERIPSVLTTPESPQVHGLLALMREHGVDAAAMEVSSHALQYGRVDGVRFDVVGFTNLTQDHLDLHGSMAEYFSTKAGLFQPDRARRAVITVDDEWGRRMAEASGVETWTLQTDAADRSGMRCDWEIAAVERRGLGHAFELRAADGRVLSLGTGLPGDFNMANAALAALMVLASGVPLEQIQQAAASHDPFSVAVPGRMQLVGAQPAAIVDFAHNPDALARTLRSVRKPGSAGTANRDPRVIVVFGATGDRDRGKRPLMGAIAARLADVVIVTDDDPHDEDEAQIRAEVLHGAVQARDAERIGRDIQEIHPRATAIDYAVSIAGPDDVILVAGRGHEAFQEVKGVNLALDDRLELRNALLRHGFTVLPSDTIES